MVDQSLIKIATADGRVNFEPGEMVHISIDWQLDTPPKMADLRLIWYTRGKGDEDVSVVARVPFTELKATDRRTAEFLIPESPYGFSGKLISLIWAVELILGKDRSQRLDLVVAPGAKEIQLTPLLK